MPNSYFKKLTNWLRNNFPDLIMIAIIIGVGVFVAFRNYIPGTWLLGWDDLVPELNFKLNILRSLSAVWQEYQGLGLLGGMAHAADLPRQLILMLSSLVLPTSFLRYFWAFLMLILGPLGVYHLVSRVLTGSKAGPVQLLAGFTAAIFYLFNLATVQTFFTPFETFVSFYGFFPWLIYFALDFLKNGGRKRLLSYFAVSVIAASAFYVQTLFVVYAIFLFVFALEATIRWGRSGLVRSVKLGLVTIIVNAFWLLPVVWFALTSSGVPAASHINSIATPETQYMNQARGDFSDIASLKGYWFDYYDLGNSGKYDYLYKDWIGYTQNGSVKNIPVYLFYASMVGLFFAFFKKDYSYKFSLPILLATTYLFLAGNNPPTGTAFKFLSDKVPFFADIFRNAFTKWSVPAAFLYSLGLGILVYTLAGIFRGKLKVVLAVMLSIAVIYASIYQVLPVFRGKLIADSMRVNLPSYYLETINYFNSQDPTARIADFPLTDFWGWKFNEWGYRGSGFLWYGLPQPILDRAFDVWSPYNEQFFNEASYDVSYGTVQDFEKTLQKYQVGYIIFDGSIIEPGDPYSASNLQKEKNFIESSSLISKEKTFGDITIYKVNLQKIVSFISAPKNDLSLPKVTTGQTGNLVTSESFGGGQGYSQVKNCDLNGNGTVTRIKTGEGTYYTAEGGASACDYFYYPTLDYSKAYKMRIVGSNLSGRSLKIYLYNIRGQKVDMQELLPPGDFDKSFVILPTASKPGGEGYTLNVETRSFGTVKSENIIRAIEFYNLDYGYSGAPASISGNLAVKNVQKFGTWGYKGDVQDSGLIELGQGYDKDWIALQTQNSNLITQIYNSKLKILKHIKVNGWANGWVVPSSQPFNQSTIYLFYWPQILEWAGGILALISLVIIAWPKKLNN